MAPPYTTGLVLSLDASIGVWKDAAKTSAATAAGDTLYTWADQSGLGNDLIQATAGIRPNLQPNMINSLPVVRFNGSNSFMANAGLTAASQSQTVFIVYKPYKREVQQMLFYQGASYQMQQQGLGGYSLYDGASHTAPIQTVSPSREYQVLAVIANGTTGTVRQNGLWSANMAGSLASNALTGFTLASSGTAYYLNADIAEVLVYNTALTGSNLSAVENYLLTKYNLPAPLPTNVPLVVYEGDSITFGSGTTGNDQEWPETTYQGNKDAVTYNYRNMANPSSTLATDLPARASYVDSLYNSARGTGNNILVVFAGTNDIWLSGASAATAFTSLSNYCTARKTTGWKIIVVTMLPRASSTPNEATRQTFNASIRSGYTSFADVLCDVGNDSVLGQNGVQSNTVWFNVDQIHPNAGGNGIINAHISTAICKALVVNYTAASNVLLNVNRGDGVLGTYTPPAVGNVRLSTTYGAPGSLSTGTLALPAANTVSSGTQYGAGGTEFTGSYTGGGGGTFPTASQVLSGVTFGPTNNLTGNIVLPSVGNVRLSTTYGASSAQTGTLALPAASNVVSGIQFGAGGTEFTGSASGGSGPTAQQIVDTLMAYSVETGISVKQLLQTLGAYAGGQTDGTSAFKALGNPGTTRISYTLNPTTKARTISLTLG